MLCARRVVDGVDNLPEINGGGGLEIRWAKLLIGSGGSFGVDDLIAMR
jgi:hypothetical protein